MSEQELLKHEFELIKLELEAEVARLKAEIGIIDEKIKFYTMKAKGFQGKPNKTYEALVSGLTKNLNKTQQLLNDEQEFLQKIKQTLK